MVQNLTSKGLAATLMNLKKKSELETVKDEVVTLKTEITTLQKELLDNKSIGKEATERLE
jgi:cell division protein FtsB